MVFKMKELVLKIILQGCGLGVLLILVCAIGIRKGAVGMVHLYDPKVQDKCVKLNLITHEKIKKTALLFKICALPVYIAYILVCVYLINSARGFLSGFLQMLAILSVLNLIDRFLIDEFWVGRTKSCIIPGTEDLRPYISADDKRRKWLFGTVGAVVISAVLSAIMMIFIH